jgi:hypothetical protein
VWRWISGLLANPDKVRAGIEAMMDQEREGAYRDPNRESRAWQEKLAEADRMHSNHQEMAVKGFIYDLKRVEWTARRTREHAHNRYKGVYKPFSAVVSM